MNRRSRSGVRDMQQTLLLGLALVIAPLAAYPDLLGIHVSLSFGMLYILELVYYASVLKVRNVATNLPEAVVGAGITMVFRHCVGGALGVMIYAVGRQGFGDALLQGIFWYQPALFLHIIASPFVMSSPARAFLTKLAGVVEEKSEGQETRTPVAVPHHRVQHEYRQVNPLMTDYGRPQRSGHGDSDAPALTHTHRARIPDNMKDTDIFGVHVSSDRREKAPQNGFERAVAYLGEVAAVRVASVVDHEGLEMASFTRGGFKSWGWSPRSLSIVNGATIVFPRTPGSAPERVETIFSDLRVISCRVTHFYLMVVSERHDEDMLSVRVAQACEMIERYATARYSEKLFSNVEAQYVRSAQ